MAQEVEDTTIASGSDMSELLENIGAARGDGWISSGPIMSHGQHLTQTMIKLGSLRAS